MPVIINDFEVVSEAPPPAQSSPEPAAAAAPPGSNPLDIRRIIDEQIARLLRVWAH